jgi:hypothetical protein
MNKQAFARKPWLAILFMLALLALVTAVSISRTQTAFAASEQIRITEDSPYYEVYFPKLSFEIDTGTYVPGTCMRVCSNAYPKITITQNGTEQSSQVSYQYAQRETIVTGDNFSDLSWITFESGESWNEGVLTIDESIIGAGFTDIFTAYFYFRTLITVDNIDYYYISPTYVDVMLDCSSISAEFGISEIQATYNKSGVEMVYNVDSSEPEWVASPITFKVKGLDNTKDNTEFFYSIDGGISLRPFEIITVTTQGVNTYYGTATISDSYAGEVLFFACDKSHTELENYLGGRKFIRLDMIPPEFTVTATTIDYSDATLPTIPYYPNRWANGDVVYTLSRLEGSIGLSGMTFQVKDINAGNTWVNLESTGGAYTYTVRATTRSLNFRAYNEAGSVYSPNVNYGTYISTYVPKIGLIAVDKENTTIKSMGTTPDINYRVGYASDSVSFTLVNENPEPRVGTNPLPAISYLYAIRETDAHGNITTSPFYEMNADTGNYRLTYSIADTGVQLKNRTYIFKLLSEAGFYDTEEFTVSVLKSDFSFTMDALSVNTNAQGWVVFGGSTEAEISANAERGVPVSLYVESFLGGNDEYTFFSEVYGDNTTRKQITDIERDTTYTNPNGLVRYIVHIKETLDRKKMSFFVVNKAEAVSPILVTSSELRLDTAKPVPNVTKKIGSLDLYENEWAANGVQIRITPTATVTGNPAITTNISGVKCYPLMGGGTVLGREIALTDGYFAMGVTQSGENAFRLVSGAGVYTDFTVVVNIDDSEFGKVSDKKWITVETMDGQELELDPLTSDRYQLKNKTAQPLRITFNTTHGTHIVYEWAEMVDNVIPSPSDFVRVENPYDEEQAFIFSIATGATGTVSYVFNLYTKAKNSSGAFASYMGIVLIINYDNATFSISASTDKLPNKWTKENIAFTISVPDNVTISRYQIRLGSGPMSYWQDITLDGSNVYTFTGIERFITTVVSEDYPEEVNTRSYGFSYCGEIWFRAISDAGKESQECYVGNYMIDKIDRIAGANNYIYGMHPLYAFYQNSGDYTVDDEHSRIYIYTNSSVFIEPSELSTNLDVKTLYEGKSPVLYYYLATDSASSTPPTWGSATQVTSSTALNSGWYWVIARNTVFETTITYKVYIAKENSVQNDSSVLTAEFATYSGVGATDSTVYQGYFVFKWSNMATVLITADSNSPVYYWYKIGANGAWQIFDPGAGAQITDGSAKEITFVGEETAKDPEFINRTDVIKAGNIQQTVTFRVTNLAGNVVYVDRSVVVQIEDSVPAFDITLRSTDLAGRDITINANNADELNKWYPNAIQLILTPTASNPGGVIYKYQRYVLVGGVPQVGELQKLPGNGTNFTTDDLSVFQNSDGYVNGALYIYLVATSVATKKTYSYPLLLKIDKTLPEFTLRGKVTVGGVEKDIASGEWTNSTGGVTIYRYVSEAVQASMDNASGVIYQYRRNGSVLQNWDSSSQTENSISSYVFIATTGAGRTYTRTFEVRIDTLPPVIHSGYIEQNLDRIETYYIDQAITYDEVNLKYAKYNEFPLSNGQIIATDTVDVSNGGYVHIIIEDLAGNKTELEFYMKVFPLNVNTITLSESDRQMLVNYENTFIRAKSGLRSSRQEYFEAYISRLWDRIATLEKMRDDYRAYLTTINSRVAFNLQDDYPEMSKYINYFITNDTSILYPQWLQDEIREGVYDTYYLKLENEYAKLKALMVDVENVEEMVTVLPAINIVERGDYQYILRVYNAYESLSTDQKSVFRYTLYNKLLELKRKCEVLLLQDPTTGVSIDGKDLAAGVEIKVTDIPKTREIFNNAQRTLLETVGENEAIVSISQITLSGYGSQQDTGTVTITLPIPSTYYDYIYFSVYKLASDGTITSMSDMTINGDGLSVYFTDTQLGTYILATRGNITVRPPSEKIYGKIGDIEINGTLLTYIAYVAVGMFVVLLVIMILMTLKRGGFFRRYNRAYKNSFKARGIKAVPKGNPAVPTMPYDPTSIINPGKKYYNK